MFIVKDNFLLQIYLNSISLMNTLKELFELSKSGQERDKIILTLVKSKSLFLPFWCSMRMRKM